MGPYYTRIDIGRRSGARRRGRDDGDLRSDFAKDRDRILYTSALLRLAGKTQVVSAGEAGLYHNRLTHTLKVAQLGRRAATQEAKAFLSVMKAGKSVVKIVGKRGLERVGSVGAASGLSFVANFATGGCSALAGW